jgi:hypothetical protein
MKPSAWWFQVLAVAVASGLGIGIAAVDRAAPFGDDSSQFTVLLWLLSSSLLGFAMPRQPWRWAVFVGPWLPLMYLVLQVLRWHAPINPNTYTTSLILIPVSLAVCAVGAYAGAWARRIFLPPSRPGEVLSGTGT